MILASRLALCKHAKIDFDAFTLLYDDIYEDDVTVPKELCRVEHIPHHEVLRDCKPDYAVREAEYLDHISGLVQDEDRLYYAHQQFEPLVQQFGEVALLRSGVWPNVMEWYRRSFTPTGPGFDCFDWFGAQPVRWKRNRYRNISPGRNSTHSKDFRPAMCSTGTSGMAAGFRPLKQGFDLIDHVVSLQPANCGLSDVDADGIPGRGANHQSPSV